MRYSVRYYAASRQWFVIDSAVGIEVVGIYGSKDAAVSHAKKSEEKWLRYGRAGASGLRPAA
ncbi:MAG: hypothetical protein QGI13_08975 [Rhodospirillales bacterium]|jgi:hypothetical protein|nr:hypothetical protein [Rhodospirillales bacterium]